MLRTPVTPGTSDDDTMNAESTIGEFSMQMVK